MAGRTLTEKDYRLLAAFRCELRRFLARSENVARGIGIPPQQHQALLAVRGYAGPGEMSISDLADCLFIRHHSAVELVDRLVERGLLARHDHPDDRRKTSLVLTDQAHAVLGELTETHVEEIQRIAPLLNDVFKQLG